MVTQQDWGRINYSQAVEKQLETLDHVSSSNEDVIVFCTHPPIVTLGRSSQPNDVMGWKGEVVKTSRGGRATYHGPNQLVVYPIVNLTNENRSVLKAKDIHSYLSVLGEVMAKAVKSLGLPAEAKTVEQVDQLGNKLSLTGVWVEDKKVASIGVAIKKWVTYHGVAVNLTSDSQAFAGINPCGFQSNVMTDLETLLGREVDRKTFQQSVFGLFLDVL